MANYAIILAAGDGKRLGSKTPKCMLKLDSDPIWAYSVETFSLVPAIKQIILVVPSAYKNRIKHWNPIVKIVAGGKDRNESFECGLAAIENPKHNDKIIVHDAARPFVQIDDIKHIIKSKRSFGTLCYFGKKNPADYKIGKYNVQTPQFCRYSVYKLIKQFNPKGRDLFSYMKLQPRPRHFILSSTRENNYKITTKRDFERALKRLA